MRPALVVVAHGSRDPRSAATVRDLARAVQAAAPQLDVRVAFLDLSTPHVTDVVERLHAEGHRHVVAVPLLLGSAYHARVDLPALVTDLTSRFPRLTVSVSDVLGADPRLEEVALDRVTSVLGEDTELTDPELGVVLSAVGSSHAPANDVVSAMARRWQARYGCLVSPAFASTAIPGMPDVPAAVARLRARGATRFVVASWFLAPGLLPDRVRGLAERTAPGTPCAAMLGADDRVAEVVLARASAVTDDTRRTA